MRVRKDTVILERRFVPKDAVIIEEGELGAQAYLIQSGAVRVYTSHEDREVELARLGVGQIVGEMAMIFDGPRTASVQATEDCNLIVISRPQFMDKLQHTDPTIKAVVHMLTSRIMDVNNSLINKRSDVTDLKDTVRMIYQNVMAGLPKNRQRRFQANVFPALESFLEAIESFQDKYGEDE